MKFLLILLAFFFTACGDMLRTAPPATVGSGIPITSTPSYPNSTPSQNPAGTETNPSPLPEFGDVRCHSSQATQFNQQVRNFLSASSDPNQAQYIIKCSQTQKGKGGFFIRGKVYFGGQKFDTQSHTQNLTVSQNSHLEIHIIDINGRPATRSGQLIKMNIEPHASAIRGQDATLAFQDQNTAGQALGKVFLNGSVEPDKYNRPIFSGTFEFENFIAWDGSLSDISGTIGAFKIAACRFFECASTLPESL